MRAYVNAVLYARGGQTSEEEMFSNQEGSPRFTRFLELLGERVPLAGWQEYRGGLDVSPQCLTGTHSVYTRFRTFASSRHLALSFLMRCCLATLDPRYAQGISRLCSTSRPCYRTCPGTRSS